MRKKRIMSLLGTVAMLSLAFTACQQNKLPEGKAIYQPEEFAGQDWWSEDNDYSYRRMECTDNLAIFWQKGFGDNLANPVFPIMFSNIVYDLASSLEAEVNVEIRERYTLRIEESLEEQVVLHRIDIGDCDGVGNKGTCAASSSRMSSFCPVAGTESNRESWLESRAASFSLLRPKS